MTEQERVTQVPGPVVAEMDRIKRLFDRSGSGDREDLITYAREVAQLRAAMQPSPATTLVDHAPCNGEGWIWSNILNQEIPCSECDGSGVDPDKDFKTTLIDLIGEFGREVFYMMDDCETSGDVGEEIHTITTDALEKVSDILDRIDALPFEEPGVILGTGAKLQAAIKQTFKPATLSAQQPTPQEGEGQKCDAVTSQEAGITPACKCASYNRPDLGGDVPEVVLQVPEWAKTPERETICVDACIADHVKSLWSAGIWTLNSCCGHNGAFSRSIIVDRSDHAAAQAIMDQMGAGIKIMSWQLCPQPAALTVTPQQAAKVLLECDQDTRARAWRAVRDAPKEFGMWFSRALHAIAEEDSK